MSKEYIERKRAIADASNALELYPSEFAKYVKLEDAINRIPAADVVEVVHGRWEGADIDARCSVCGTHPLKDMDMDIVYYWSYKPNYCPNCGAKMDGGADNG